MRIGSSHAERGHFRASLSSPALGAAGLGRAVAMLPPDPLGQVNPMNDPHASAGAGPSPTYEPPPTPNSERPGSAYLILGINVVLMAGAIWYVWHRQHGKDPSAGTNVANDPAATAHAPGDPTSRPVVGTKGLLDAR